MYCICGCCARSVIRTKHCEDCKILWRWTKGPLLFPLRMKAICLQQPLFFNKLTVVACYTPKSIYFLWACFAGGFFEIKETESLKQRFLKAQHQQRLFSDIMDRVVGEHFEMLFGKTYCTKGHNMADETAARFFNTMSKNLVKDVSSDATHDARKRQRKALKLSGNSTCT